MCVGENTSQPVSVRIVRRRRTVSARNGLHPLCRKTPQGFFDSLRADRSRSALFFFFSVQLIEQRLYRGISFCVVSPLHDGSSLGHRTFRFLVIRGLSFLFFHPNTMLRYSSALRTWPTAESDTRSQSKMDRASAITSSRPTAS